MLGVSFSIAAVVIATANSLPATSSDTSISQELASLNQSLDSGLNLSTNATAADAEVIVENCGNTAVDIRIRVLQARHVAMRAYSDSQLGVSSPHGFRAMFKTNDAIVGAEVILQNIFVFRAKGGLKPHPGTYLEPRFACVTEDMSSKYDYLHLGYDPWRMCLTYTREQVFPAAFYAAGTAYIFLCPVYQIQIPSPSTSHCPGVDIEGANVFVGNQYLFSRRYQLYTLIYELARFYLGDHALSGNTIPREQFDWNHCVFDLGPLNSLRNPTNMELYVALVAQQCTQAPDLRSELTNGSHSNSTTLSNALNQSPVSDKENAPLTLLPPPKPAKPATFLSSNPQLSRPWPGTTISTSRQALATDGAAMPGHVPPSRTASGKLVAKSTAAAVEAS